MKLHFLPFLLGLISGLNVVLVGVETTSHVLSLAGLAEALAAEGHHVTFACQDEHIGLLNSTLVRPRIRRLSAGRFPNPSSFYGYTQTLPEFLSAIHDHSVSSFDSLVGPLQQLCPDVLVFDATFPVGNALREVLSSSCGTVGIAWSGGTVYLQHLASEGVLTPGLISGKSSIEVDAGPLSRFQNYLVSYQLFVAQILRYFLVQRPFYQHVRSSFPYVEGWSLSSPYGLSVPLLGVAAFGVEQPLSGTALPMYHQLGPMLPRASALQQLPQALAEWFGLQNNVVFISLGTNAQWNKDLAAAVVSGIRLLRQVDPQLSFLFSLGDNAKSEYFSHLELPDYIRTEPFLNQLAVLQQPTLGCFVTHGGFASLQEALFYNIPSVGLVGMLESDQPTNVARAEMLGVMVSLDRNKQTLDAEAFRSAVTTCLHSNSLKDNVRTWSEHLKSLGGPAQAVRLIEMYHSLPLRYFASPEALAPFWHQWEPRLVLLAVLFTLQLFVKRLFCLCRQSKSKTE